MRELAIEWYVVLSSLSATVAGPLRDAGEALGLPILSALLFGLIGATAPCQLTTSAGALAYVARDAADAGGRGAIARGAAAYALGKMAVYTVAGLVVIVARSQRRSRRHT